MTRYSASPDDRDDDAADRDDAADDRDLCASDRDTVAGKRDAQAVDRDDQAVLIEQELRDRLDQVRQQILDRLARLENTSVDPADWRELTPAALARLRDHTAEQRHLAALDRAALSDLLDDLRNLADRSVGDRVACSRDRQDAEHDRHAAAQDRGDAGRDRDDSSADRAQAAIERQQVDPGHAADAVPGNHVAWADSLADRVAQTVATSRRRIDVTRAFLGRNPDHLPPTTAPNRDDVPDRPDHPHQQSRNTPGADPERPPPKPA